MVIAANIPALLTVDTLAATQQALGGILAQLASGDALAAPGANPADAAMTTLMAGTLGADEASPANVQQGQDLLAVAAGGLATAVQMVQQLEQLAVQASNSSQTPATAQALQAQADALLQQIDQLG